MKPGAQGTSRLVIRALVSCLSGLALFALGGTVLAAPVFDAPFLASLTNGEPVLSVALGDFDEDGVIDAAVTFGAPSSVAIHQGDGNGGFLPATSYEVASANEVAAGDLNEDGHLDLVVTSFNAHLVSVLLGDGHGQFSPGVTYPAAPGALGVALGDLNSDDHIDVVVTNNSVDSVSVLLGAGDGTLLPRITTATTFSPYSIAMGDWSGDGILDVAVSRDLGGGVTLMRGMGDGTFEEDRIDLTTDGRAYGVHLRDLNGDGRLDVATAVQKVGTVEGAFPLSVFLAQQDGSFGPRQDHGAGRARSLAMGDWDSDGDLDAALGRSEPGGIAVLLGDGSGGFGAQMTFPGASGSTSVLAAGLIDDDTVLDLIAPGSSTLAVHAGNGDGTFGGGATYPAFSAVTSIAVADFDRDGTLDVAASTALESPTQISVFLGDGGGAFGPREDYVSGTGFGDLEAGDVDGDGFTDLVQTSSSGEVVLLRGLGDGSFEAAQEFPCGPDPQDLELVDLNGDGRSDAAVVNLSYPATLSVLLALPGGGFAAPVAYPLGGNYYPLSLTSKDFNEDGNQDIVVAHGGPTSIFLGVGDGTLGTATSSGGGGNGPITSGDVDQDGEADFVTAGQYGVYLHRGLGDGTFYPAVFTPFEGGVASLEIGDVDADGRRDLIAACGGLGTLSVLFGDAIGFADWTHYGAGPGPVDVAVGDWNHDGKLDLMAGLLGGGAISVLLQEGGPTTTSPTARAVLHQNAPNPFNPETTIRFDLNATERVKVTIYDVHGRVVARLLDQTLPGGPHQVSWSGLDASGRGVASGVYLYRLETPSTEASRKMVLAR